MQTKSKFPVIVAAFILGICVLTGLLVRLQCVPAMWWDEGWTASVARTWIETGHYGLMRSGDPAPPGLSAAFPVVLPVALSFRLFGVGVWQARLPMVLLTIATITIFCILAYYCCGLHIAFVAMLMLILTPGDADLHCLILGRQVLGEIPSILYLLLGYFCLGTVLRKYRTSVLILAILFSTLALRTKAQVLPFWTFSMLVPLVLAFRQRNRRVICILMAVIIGSAAGRYAMPKIEEVVLQGKAIYQPALQGLYATTAAVLVPKVRFSSLFAVLVFGPLTVSALGYAVWKTWSCWTCEDISDAWKLVRVALLTLVVTWVCWYLLLGTSWLRYFFSAIFLGSLFTAELIWSTVSRSVLATRKQELFQIKHLLPFVLITGFAVNSILLTSTSLFSAYVRTQDSSLRQAADYLNTNTPPSALIETYESELFLFLNRRYHYPPDQVHVELNRRTFLGEKVPIGYDPLNTAADYLVVGRFGKMWGLYDSILSGSQVKHLVTIGDYRIYKMVNESKFRKESLQGMQ